MNHDRLLHHLQDLQHRLQNLHLGLAGFENLHVLASDHDAMTSIEALQTAAYKAIRHLDGLLAVVVEQTIESTREVA